MAISSWMTPFTSAACVTALNVVVASGFSIAGLLKPKSILADAEPTRALLVFAMYAAARTLPVALATAAVIALRAVSPLIAFGLLAGLIQAADAAVGAYQRDLGKTVGPLAIAALQFAATYALWRAT